MKCNILQEQDMFGSPVSLNFADRGSSINTNTGGLVSIVIKIFMTWFLVSKSITLFSKGSNSYTFKSSYTDFDELGKVSLEDSGFLIMM